MRSIIKYNTHLVYHYNLSINVPVINQRWYLPVNNVNGVRWSANHIALVCYEDDDGTPHYLEFINSQLVSIQILYSIYDRVFIMPKGDDWEVL